jgi:YVTN family beta-propeller protein
MLIQPHRQISVLALLDPEIPGGRLLDDGTWGINLAAARLNYPDKGLKVQIPAWNNMRKSDNCKLYLGTTMVAQKTITEDIEVDKHVTLFIEPPRLPSGDRELSYQITRFGQKPEPGPTIKLFVKLELPGGQDLNPDYGHSELTMAFDPPDVVRDGVDKATAEKGVLVYAKPKPGDGWLYLNCAVGDVLILGWAGKTVESEPVTQEQLDDPEGNPIVVLADKDIILSAGDSDGVSVSYKIRDCVYNESEDWCEAVRIVVDTQGLRLGAPILKQADGLIVDLEALGEERPLVEVWAEDVNIFKKFDEIYLSIFGTDDEGKEISELVIQRIESNPPVRVSIAHKNSTLRALAKRTVVYSYHVRRGGGVVDNSRSKSRAYSVIGEATRLAAPIALDAISGALNPNAPEYRIRIPYDLLITPDNAIELKLFGTRSDLTIYDPELDWYFPSQDEADDPEGFIITVAGEHGKTLEGGTLRLSYNLLTDEDGTITRRASLHASLLNVGEAQRELVKPIVLGEKDGALEPKDLPGGVSKITAPRPVAVPTEPYDIVKFFWIVEGNEPVTDSKVLNTLSKDKDVNFPLNAAFVAQHIEPNRGKKVKVNYEIFRAASNTTSYSNDLEFTVGQPVALDPPTIDSVTGSVSGKEIPSGSGTTEISFQFQGEASAGLTVELQDNAVPVETITVDANGAWDHTLDAQSTGDHRYTVRGNYGAMPESEAWNIKIAEKEIFEPPKIKEAPDNILQPIAAKDALTTVVMAFANMIDTQITVTWTGTDGPGTRTFGPFEVTTQGDQFLPLDNAVVPFNLGKPVTVSYTVKRGDNEPAPSPPCTITVSPMPESALEKSWITEASNDGAGPELDITALVNGASIRTNIWPLGAVGQPVELTLQGKKADGVPHDCALLTRDKNAVHQAWLDNGYYTVTAPYSYLKDLPHGSELKLVFKASLDTINVVTFPLRVYTVSKKQFGVPGFNNAPYTIAPHGQLKAVEMHLRNSSNTPIAGGHLSLTLPANFTYSDGDSGQRDFITDAVGRVTVSGVKGTQLPGSYTLSATSGIQVDTANVAVTGLGPEGKIPVGIGPDGIAISPDGTRAYVSNSASHTISVIDTATNKVLTTIPVGNGPRWVAVSPDGTRAYVCSYDRGSVAVIDTTSNRVMTNISCGTYTRGIAFNPDGTRAYVSNFGSHTISVIDTATDQVLTNIPTGNSPYGVAVSPDGNRVYVSNWVSNTVSVIDSTTDRVLTSIPIGTKPTGIAINPDGTRVYASNWTSNTVSVIDTATDQVLTNIQVGNNPYWIAVSPESSRIFVSNHGSHTVSIIDTTTNKVLKNIPGGSNPYGIAVSTDGTRAYVGNATSSSVLVIGGLISDNY